MLPRRAIGLLAGLVVLLAAATPAAAATGEISVESPTSGTSCAAYPSGTYGFDDCSGTFRRELFAESADPLTVTWKATGVPGDVTVKIVLDGEIVKTTTLPAGFCHTFLDAATRGEVCVILHNLLQR